MAEFPALPLWTDALIADAGHLSNAEFGLYLRILILMWRTPGCKIPNDLTWISRKLCNSSEKDIADALLEFCTTDGNWVFQKRLRREYEFQRSVRQKATDNANRRWNKEKGSRRGNATNHDASNAPSPSPSTSPHIKGITNVIPKNEPSKETLDLAVNAWNALAGARGLPKVQDITKTRKASLILRLSEIGAVGWADVLQRVRSSRFLCGENVQGWTADFDWLLKPSNMQKVREGKYDNRKGTSANKSGLAEAFDKLKSRISQDGSGGNSGADGEGNGDNPPNSPNDLFRNRGND